MSEVAPEGGDGGGESKSVIQMVADAVRIATDKGLTERTSEFVRVGDRTWAYRVDHRGVLQIYASNNDAMPVIEFGSQGNIQLIVGGYGQIFDDPARVMGIFEALEIVGKI